MVLADMGARVIRIDRAPAAKASVSTEAWQALLDNDGVVDRGRESVALNLKDPRAVEVVLRLVARADVLIEGYRPGVLEKLGLGPSTCLARNPKLVYGRMTGWGQSGPLAQAAGHDINYVALSGALAAIGPRDQPVPPLNLVGDYGGGGMLLVAGVLGALLHARQAGVGQVVDAAMSDGAALLMAAQYGFWAKGLWRLERSSNFIDGGAHFYGVYPCADGRHVAIGAIEPSFYKRLLQLCGVDDPLFERQWEAGLWPVLRERLAAVFLQRTQADWCQLLEGSDACFAPVLDLSEAAAHPHNQARATVVCVDGVWQPAPAPRFDKTPTQVPAKAPLAGAHTPAVLAEAGLDPDAVQVLLSAGVAYQSPPVPVEFRPLSNPTERSS
jgi:alpha-methylacyl-CoA racemase